MRGPSRTGAASLAAVAPAPAQALRRSFLALFTRKALSMYVQQQDGIIRQHLAGWMEGQAAAPGPREVRNLVRDMNANTSQRVFVGEWRAAAAQAGFAVHPQHIAAQHTCIARTSTHSQAHDAPAAHCWHNAPAMHAHRLQCTRNAPQRTHHAPAPMPPPGPYLDDPKVAAKFSDAYMDMTGGFLTFPLKFPGTAVWRAMKVRQRTRARVNANAASRLSSVSRAVALCARSSSGVHGVRSAVGRLTQCIVSSRRPLPRRALYCRQGRQYILSVLEEAAVRSKQRMREGGEPACLLDFWTQQILAECDVSVCCAWLPACCVHARLACAVSAGRGRLLDAWAQLLPACARRCTCKRACDWTQTCMCASVFQCAAVASNVALAAACVHACGVVARSASVRGMPRMRAAHTVQRSAHTCGLHAMEGALMQVCACGCALALPGQRSWQRSRVRACM